MLIDSGCASHNPYTLRQITLSLDYLTRDQMGLYWSIYCDISINNVHMSISFELGKLFITANSQNLRG